MENKLYIYKQKKRECWRSTFKNNLLRTTFQALIITLILSSSLPRLLSFDIAFFDWLNTVLSDSVLIEQGGQGFMARFIYFGGFATFVSFIYVRFKMDKYP